MSFDKNNFMTIKLIPNESYDYLSSISNEFPYHQLIISLPYQIQP